MRFSSEFPKQTSVYSTEIMLMRLRRPRFIYYERPSYEIDCNLRSEEAIYYRWYFTSSASGSRLLEISFILLTFRIFPLEVKSF